MGIYVQKASPFLAPYVKQYWALKHHYSPETSYTHRIIPCGLPELMFFSKDLPCAKTSGFEISERSLISGQKNTYYDLELLGKQELFSVVFNPLGLRMFFNLPMIEFKNLNIPLKEIDPKGIAELEDNLFFANNFQEKIHRIESYLYLKLQKNNRSYVHDRMHISLNEINSNALKIKVSKLSALTCYSRKQFERNFSDWVGLSPKQFIKTIRFQKLLFEKIER